MARTIAGMSDPASSLALMSGFTFVHAADLHLDSPLVGLERYEGAPVAAIRNASRQAFENLVRLATDVGAAFLVLAGDIFDGDWRDYNTGVFFHRQLARLERARVPVYIVQGNHDAQSLMTRSLRLPANVFTFPSRAPASFRVPGHEGEVVLHGQSFGAREVHQNLALGYPAPEPGLFNVGVLHTSVDGREGHAPYAPCKLSDLEARGYSYWALGHVHRREVLSERPWVVFPGNLQGRHARETGPKGATVVTVRDGAVDKVRHEPLDVVRWLSLECDVTGLATPEEVVDRLAEHVGVGLHAAEGRLLAVRLRARGATRAASMKGEPHRWRAEVLARVGALAGDAAWVEKVVLDLEPEVALDPATGESLAVLERILSELAAQPLEGAPDFAQDLERRLGPLAGRSDAHLEAADAAPTSPAGLARARAEAVELLRTRLRAPRRHASERGVSP